LLATVTSRTQNHHHRAYEDAMIRAVGFIGLGNVGGKLAATLLRNGFDLVVRDLDEEAAAPLLAGGATWGSSPRQMARDCDIVITCLPNPAASASVMEAEDGLLAGLRAGAVWAEMSTTDEAEVRRLATLVAATGAAAVDCPVSGGCHRAATGNIAIFAGCDRPVFERVLPVLTTMGRHVLHTGPVGSASVLKVVTNYLATANLVALCEALVTSAAAGMDLATAYEAIRLSSGTSFVHETEGPGDPQRQPRHQLHDGPRRQGPGTVPGRRGPRGRAVGGRPGPARGVRRRPRQIRAARVVAQHHPPPRGRNGPGRPRRRVPARHR
jgi:3-hydroxyisobutyrate dehydrogenase-like beta-hydroxyacid dehydrogenase